MSRPVQQQNLSVDTLSQGKNGQQIEVTGRIEKVNRSSGLFFQDSSFSLCSDSSCATVAGVKNFQYQEGDFLAVRGTLQEGMVTEATVSESNLPGNWRPIYIKKDVPINFKRAISWGGGSTTVFIGGSAFYITLEAAKQLRERKGNDVEILVDSTRTIRRVR